MDMYVAEDGVPTDFHLVHLGGKALGGAGLVMTEMICTSAEGRITPGVRRPVDRRAARRLGALVDFVHGESSAAIGCQLGHSGAKGSTKLMWEGIDEPLPTGNWDVVAASPVPYSPANQTPLELDRAGTRHDPRRVRRLRPRARPRRASTCSSCTARTATCCRASCRP